MKNETGLRRLLVCLLVAQTAVGIIAPSAQASSIRQCQDFFAGRKTAPEFSMRPEGKQTPYEELKFWLRAQDTLLFFPNAEYLIPGYDGMNRQHGKFFALTHVLKKLSRGLTQSKIDSEKAQADQTRNLAKMRKDLTTLLADELNLSRQKVMLEEALAKEEAYVKDAPSVLGETRIQGHRDQVSELRNRLWDVRYKIMTLPNEVKKLESAIRTEESPERERRIADQQAKFEERSRGMVIAAAELLVESVSGHFRTEEAMLNQSLQRAGKADSPFHQEYLRKHFAEHHVFEAEMANILASIQNLSHDPKDVVSAAKSLAIKIDTWLILHIKVNDTLTYEKMK